MLAQLETSHFRRPIYQLDLDGEHSVVVLLSSLLFEVFRLILWRLALFVRLFWWRGRFLNLR